MTLQFIADARCLQDPNYSTRGVGQHVRALLRYRRREVGDALHITGILDRQLPPLSCEDRLLFEDLHTTAYSPRRLRWTFLSTSPMTHSPLPMAQLLIRPDFKRAALVYDFIPHDMPGQYLASQKARISYEICLTWLRRFDHFFPISNYTSQRLQKMLNVLSRRCTVTGVSVRKSLLPPDGTSAAMMGERYILVVGGGDARKNPEVAIVAHGGSTRLAAAGIRLMIAGNYPEPMQRHLRETHTRAGGRPELLSFLPHISDEDLRSRYAAALCTVAPSRMEGFSIPIVEASANGCPVLASNCEAQAELFDQATDLFDPNDANTLRCRLERIIFDPAERERIRVRQASVWRRFTESEVGGRFWEAALRIAGAEAPAIVRGTRPRIAFLTPLPPAASGVADYSFATLRALATRADLEVFSDTPDAHVPEGALFAGETSAIAHLHPRFDAVVSVIGNSPFHVREFDLLIRHGAAAIAHDARMLTFYRIVLGQERAIAAASAELGRPVSLQEIDKWLADERQLPTLFLREIAEAANPLIVHSPVTVRYLGERYSLACARLPFVPYRQFAVEELAPLARVAARQQLDIPEHQLVIASFGYVHQTKAIEDCVRAVGMLCSWNLDARLVFVGHCLPDIAKGLLTLARRVGVEGRVLIFDSPVSENQYRSWLLAADIALQLRVYQLGGLSGALLDCAAAALPTVANAHLADACEAPPYIRRVPDEIDALYVAQAMAEIVETGLHNKRPLDECRAALADRNFEAYAERLLTTLNLH